jgi:hypothetical protein
MHVIRTLRARFGKPDIHDHRMAFLCDLGKFFAISAVKSL